MENTYLGKDVIIMCENIEIQESEIRIEESEFKHLTALEYLKRKLGKEILSYGSSNDK